LHTLPGIVANFAPVLQLKADKPIDFPGILDVFDAVPVMDIAVDIESVVISLTPIILCIIKLKC